MRLRCTESMNINQGATTGKIIELGLHDFDEVYSESDASERLEEEALIDFDNQIAERIYGKELLEYETAFKVGKKEPNNEERKTAIAGRLIEFDGKLDIDVNAQEEEYEAI